MRKTAALLLIFCLCLSLTACTPSKLATEAKKAAGEGLDYSDGSLWIYNKDASADGLEADCFLVCPSVYSANGGDYNMPTYDGAALASFKGALNMEKEIYSETCVMYAPVYRQVSLEVYDMPEEEAEEEGEAEYDEHVWLSLRNAKQFTAEIARVLGELDPDHAAEYKGNADTYTASLDDLDSRYQEAVSGGRVSTLLFGDRFPFRYLTEDYGLDYYAAFAGCSAETEASFETIAFLTQKADELQLHTILKIEGEGNRIADTIAQNASYKDMKVSVLNSMQGISQKEIEEGKDYLSIMEDNLQVLTEALQ